MGKKISEVGLKNDILDSIVIRKVEDVSLDPNAHDIWAKWIVINMLFNKTTIVILRYGFNGPLAKLTHFNG